MKLHGARLFLKYSVAGSTVIRAAKVALVVGPILTVLNHTHEIAALDFSWRFLWQTVLTFCVPYAVSTYSSAMTEVQNARAAAREDGAAGPAAVGGAHD